MHFLARWVNWCYAAMFTISALFLFHEAEVAKDGRSLRHQEEKATLLEGSSTSSNSSEAYSTNATLVLLTEAAEKDYAVCLDGSPPGYYIRPGYGTGLHKWIIHHEGGGWCESLHSCWHRQYRDIGTSTVWLPSVALPDVMRGDHQANGDYLSEDPSVNPMMYNWNVAYLLYCDGSSFTGNNATSTLYNGTRLHFRGLAILRAMQQHLLSNGLEESTDVVISGESAGGLAVYFHVDKWASLLEAPGRRVVGMADSGFFPYYNGTTHFSSGMEWIFHYQNSSAALHPDCIAEYAGTGEEHKCFFAEHTARYIQTPVFALQSQYDADQMHWAKIDENDTSTINDWGQHITNLVEDRLLASNSRHGVFMDACYHHCWGWGLYHIGGVNQPTAFQEWYYKGSHELSNRGYFRKADAYPCDACCGDSTLVM